MAELALTLRQPYVSAVMLLGKDVENRSWQIPYRGRLWIHAAATVDRPQPALLDRLEGNVPTRALLGYVSPVDVIQDSTSGRAWSGS